MTTKQKKPRIGTTQLGYRLHDLRDNLRGRSYCHLRIEIITGYEQCAGREYDRDPGEYRLERLQAIRRLGDSTRYLDGGCHDSILTLRWQADDENSAKRENPWYALRIDSGELSPQTVRVLRALDAAGIHDYSPPAAVVAVLEGPKIKARPVWHGEDEAIGIEAPYSAWIYRDYDRDILAANPFETPEERAERRTEALTLDLTA